MPFGAGHDVHEHKARLVLIDLMARQLAEYDLHEDVVRIVSGCAGRHKGASLKGYLPPI